ncbi:hypothetical protein [Alteromonas halophila]|uniref:Uncharacterized protein n=1 Tax=Alteromonas halophila TaxID=516698 RepID=A0A918JJP3_9ALTE|nr:hypothetical protein [Alteromonas halophila]GGW83633.1 hypothetical protein GCM10007391_16510 [Alteromonas halophila]
MAKFTTQRCLLTFAFVMQIWSFTTYANNSLEDQILAADARLFGAFNQCDISTFSSMLDGNPGKMRISLSPLRLTRTFL